MENRFHPVIARPQDRSNPEQMTGSPRTLRVLAMTLLLFCASLPAAAQVPGDACATAQQYKVNGGPETLGLVHMMVCEGGTWKSIVSSNAAGEVTKIGNQTCANGDFFKYDGTKLICTTGGGAALSGLTAAIADNSINNGNWNQVWNWQLAAGEIGFTFGENTASAGGSANQYILAAKTLATSTATPFMITNLGAAASFRVNDETGDADTTPFVIAADGNVGIGTSTVDANSKLHIYADTPGVPTELRLETGNNDAQIVFEENAQGNNATIRYNGNVGGSNNWLEFWSSSTLSMSLDRDTPYGVGIGVAEAYHPTAKLEVRNSGTEDILNLYDSATEVLTILDGGNVGIGTATPSHKLTVSGDFVDDGILIENIRNTDLDSGNLDFRRARGTPGAQLVPQSGDELAHITFQGYDGAGGHIMAADIIATLDGASSGGSDMPGMLTFRTRPDGGGSITTRMVIKNDGDVGIGTTSPASKFVVAPPASAAVAGGGTITADACGTIKQITSTGNVTTNTTNTFTAPTASYAGCCMIVINVDTADTITLDANTLFKTIGGANQALGPSDAVEVCSNGTAWYQIGAVSANQ